MKRTAGVLILALGLFGTPAALYAQALGSIAGAVKDASDAVLPGGRRLDGVLAALPEQGVERLAAATIEIDPPPDRG